MQDTRRCRHGRRVATRLVLALSLLATAAETAGGAECTLQPGPTRAVARVLDGETLGLDDGSEVRLVGALAPRAPDSGTDGAHWAPERDAKAALERLVQGRSVDLAFAPGRRQDRYGRHLAQVMVHQAEGRAWVQAAMVAAGHARAYVLPDTQTCLTELITHEQSGRAAAAGLWQHAAYQIRQAHRPRELMRLRSTFQIVEGRVQRVVEARGQLLLEFGEGWQPDFTAVARGAARRAAAAGLADLKELQGRTVRVRGWIERRYGPTIELHDPAQLEVMQ